MLTGIIITLIGCVIFFGLLLNVIYSNKSYVFEKPYCYLVLSMIGVIAIGILVFMGNFIDFLIRLIF